MSKKSIEELMAEAEQFAEKIQGEQRKSKLDEYKDVIKLLRDKGLSYSKVAEFLNKKASVRVSSSTVRNYVKENLEQGDDETKEDKDKKEIKKTFGGSSFI